MHSEFKLAAPTEWSASRAEIAFSRVENQLTSFCAAVKIRKKHKIKADKFSELQIEM
jgi:hypothetical protein